MIRPLERDHSCMRHFAYRMDLEGPAAVGDFVALARADGFSVASSPLPSLVKLVDACGNELLVVATTGRVQLRVAYTVPPEARRHAAEAVYCRLVRASVRSVA